MSSPVPETMRAAVLRDVARGWDDLRGPFFSMNRINGTRYDGETRLESLEGDPITMYSMGGLAEYCVIPATSITKVDDEIEVVSGRSSAVRP